ncbi:hypothetical protein EYF80_002223 [Liparis tanakae]|uniref:Uncharacterized protein n=1 Tax=Liparis tanakae TaxID=230148 RepID=A0A4Z2JBD2_9TELE|nr:hypothetical protein EYF80_002223 [Liparis tanakae]
MTQQSTVWILEVNIKELLETNASLNVAVNRVPLDHKAPAKTQVGLELENTSLLTDLHTAQHQIQHQLETIAALNETVKQMPLNQQAAETTQLVLEQENTALKTELKEATDLLEENEDGGPHEKDEGLQDQMKSGGCLSFSERRQDSSVSLLGQLRMDVNQPVTLKRPLNQSQHPRECHSVKYNQDPLPVHSNPRHRPPCPQPRARLDSGMFRPDTKREGFPLNCRIKQGGIREDSSVFLGILNICRNYENRIRIRPKIAS